jgi:hypothetical protein
MLDEGVAVEIRLQPIEVGLDMRTRAYTARGRRSRRSCKLSRIAGPWRSPRVVAEDMANGQMQSDLTAREAGLALLALTNGFSLAQNIGNRPPDTHTTTRIAEVVAQCVIRRCAP